MTTPAPCQGCRAAPVAPDDVLCAQCASAVQLGWGTAHARGPQRGERTQWAAQRRRTVENVVPAGELL